MFSLGLDISSTSSGAIVLNDMGTVLHEDVWKPPAGLDYLQRGSWQAERLMGIIEQFPPDKVCIEGYSLGSTHNAEPLITVGTIIRYFLRQMGYEWVVVAPTQLKKYAGAQLKQDIKLAVYKRWGYEHRSDDAVDAYVLAQIGRGLNDMPLDLIRPQQEVLQVLLNPKPKKKVKKEAV
jgi:crossover junction endodeoxyribonuclease RuvC